MAGSSLSDRHPAPREFLCLAPCPSRGRWRTAPHVPVLIERRRLRNCVIVTLPGAARRAIHKVGGVCGLDGPQAAIAILLRHILAPRHLALRDLLLRTKENGGGLPHKSTACGSGILENGGQSIDLISEDEETARRAALRSRPLRHLTSRRYPHLAISILKMQPVTLDELGQVRESGIDETARKENSGDMSGFGK
jgi:hypothetical protein